MGNIRVDCSYCKNRIRNEECKDFLDYGCEIKDKDHGWSIERRGAYCNKFECIIPDLRLIKCCGSCKYGVWVYDGEITCSKYQSEISPYYLCDDYIER